jgi:hypothetical protein
MIHPAMDSAVSAENASRFQQPLGKPSGFPTDSTTTTTTRYSRCPPKRGRSTHPATPIERRTLSLRGASAY